mgnify:CR=1 FL=1
MYVDERSTYRGLSAKVGALVGCDARAAEKVTSSLIASGHLSKCIGRHYVEPNEDGLMMILAGCVAYKLGIKSKRVPQFAARSGIKEAIEAAEMSDAPIAKIELAEGVVVEVRFSAGFRLMLRGLL